MTLSEIVDQLRACGYENEAGKLENNVAFVELERMAEEPGTFQPMRHDDPDNDGPVWLDENGCLCWVGALGETKHLVLHGDMTVCKWVPLEDE